MSTRFVPPSDAEIDSLGELLHVYELVRFIAWRSYRQAQEDVIMTLQQEMLNTSPWLPSSTLPLPTSGEVEG